MPLAQLQHRTDLRLRTERFTLRLADDADDLAAAQLLRGQGIEPGKEFGVAPSTLEYWREVKG